MPRGRQPDEKVYEAAFLRAELGLNQSQIADRLGVAQATAWRLLARAKDIGCLVESSQHRFVPVPPISDAWLGEMERKRQYSDLAEALARLPTRTGLQLRRLRVFDSGSDDDSFEGIERRQRILGANAARYVAERLRAARTIGVSWGSTLSRLIDGIRASGYAWPTAPPKQIVPVAAEPVTYAHNSYTSSTLARRLDTIINDEPTRPSGRAASADDIEVRRLALTGVPAFVPRDITGFVRVPGGLKPHEGSRFAQVLREYVEQCSSAYQRIFKGIDGEPPLIGRVDALLTGVGGDDKPMGFCNGDLLKFGGDMTPDALKRLVIGDVGGVLLPRPGSSDKVRRRVAELNEMWTGISEQHLIDIAARAQDEPEGAGRSGVIVICLGRRRAEVVFEALKCGFCTELVIDSSLAARLREMVPRPRGRDARAG